jgi:hypothetical protein
MDGTSSQYEDKQNKKHNTENKKDELQQNVEHHYAETYTKTQ